MAAVNQQLDSRLAQVPVEVLVRITYFISTNDLANVRLTCKVLERNLFNFFSHEFFRKKQFMVSSASLQALVDISRHPALSSCLKHVIISTDRLVSMSMRPPMGQATAAQMQCANFARAENRSLLVTGTCRDMLAAAFRNLVNLETVDIRDFNAYSRNRDGLGVPWRSYGAATLERATSMPVSGQPPYSSDGYATQLFSAVCAGLAAAQSRPRSIEVLLRDHRWGLKDDGFFIPPQLRPSMVPLLAELQSLHVDLDQTDGLFLIRKFLSLTKNLTWLRLNFRERLKRSKEEVADAFLSWLGLREGEGPIGDGAPIQLRRLERLDLGRACVWPRTLLRLVAKLAPTLRLLCLRRMALDDNHTLEMRVNPWEQFLCKLAEGAGASLRVLELSFPEFITQDCYAVNVSFMDQKTGLEVADWTCSTGNLTLEKAVQQTVKSLVTKWPKSLRDFSQSGRECSFLPVISPLPSLPSFPYASDFPCTVVFSVITRNTQ